MATVDTGLIVLSPEGPDVNNNISLLLRCQNLEPTSTEIEINSFENFKMPTEIYLQSN